MSGMFSGCCDCSGVLPQVHQLLTRNAPLEEVDFDETLRGFWANEYYVGDGTPGSGVRSTYGTAEGQVMPGGDPLQSSSNIIYAGGATAYPPTDGLYTWVGIVASRFNLAGGSTTQYDAAKLRLRGPLGGSWGLYQAPFYDWSTVLQNFSGDWELLEAGNVGLADGEIQFFNLLPPADYTPVGPGYAAQQYYRILIFFPGIQAQYLPNPWAESVTQLIPLNTDRLFPPT